MPDVLYILFQGRVDLVSKGRRKEKEGEREQTYIYILVTQYSMNISGENVLLTLLTHTIDTSSPFKYLLIIDSFHFYYFKNYF